MKTSSLFPAVLGCALLVTSTPAATDLAAGWSAELTAAQQASPQDAGGRLRAEAILRAVLDASRHGLAAETPPADASLDAAAAQAAYSALAVLYPQSRLALDARLTESLAAVIAADPAIAAGRMWGEHVAQVVLAEQDDAVFLNPSSFAAAKKVAGNPSPVAEVPIDPRAYEIYGIGPGRYQFSVLAGAADSKGHVDGIGAAARFDRPTGLAVDAAGNAYVAEGDLGTIRKITPDGVVTTLAGVAGQKGNQDGRGADARFNQPRGLAVDGAGNVYVADMDNHAVRKIDPTGLVTTLARVDVPTSLAVDDEGNVFVSDWGPSMGIRKIAPDGSVARLTLEIPLYDAGGYLRTYSGSAPSQLQADHAGNLYAIFSDYDADVVKLVPKGGGTYAGTTLFPPRPMYWPYALGLDGEGNLFVQFEPHLICLFTPGGKAEVRYVGGMASGHPWDLLAVDGWGRFFVVPASSFPGKTATVEVGVFDSGATGPSILWQPGDISVERGNSTQFSVSVAGNPALTYQWYFNSHPIAGATGPLLKLANVQDDMAGSYAVVITDGFGSVTSRSAKLGVKEPPPPPPPDGNGSGSIPPPPPPHDVGAGSFDAGISLVVLGLLAVAARRAGRTFNIAAVSTHGRKERR